MLQFIINKTFKNARTGIIKTSHGDIHTPAFAFCATKGSLKTVLPHDMQNIEMMLCNTVHMMINGWDIIKQNGGLHNFMATKIPIMTDSGGFQIFSFGHGSVSEEIKRKNSRKSMDVYISEYGATFKSYRNGDIILLTPEKSIECQMGLGSDIIVTLDECTPYHASSTYTLESMYRTHRWTTRSINKFEELQPSHAGLYGVVQGGIYRELRQISSHFMNNQNLFGICIGGSLGQSVEQMHDIVHFTSNALRKDRPIHLLGIGRVNDIFHGVKCGIDTFDCVHPTRIARHGHALIRYAKYNQETINLSNEKYTNDFSSIDEECECYTCQTFHKSYLNYMIKIKESIAIQAITIHNIFFMNKVMQHIRNAIMNDTLEQEEQYWLGKTTPM